MAQKTFKRFIKKVGKIKWSQSYASLLLGAIIVVVLGLLVANYFSRRGEQIDEGQQTTQEQEEVRLTQEYKIVAGDSLSKISEKFYDSQEFWPVLVRVNKIGNPNLIFVDATLEIPNKEEANKIKTEMSVTSYQVKEGDTLFLIAEKVYGDGSRWVVLDKTNRVGRLPNGNPLIFAGSTLVIPR